MPIPIPTTAKEASKIKRCLRKEIQYVCLDPQSYIKALLIGQEMLMRGDTLKATIVKGFDTQEAA